MTGLAAALAMCAACPLHACHARQRLQISLHILSMLLDSADKVACSASFASMTSMSSLSLLVAY
jgi:hypothetical protein